MHAREWRSQREATRGVASLGARSDCMQGPHTANDRDRTLLGAIAAGDEAALRAIHSLYYRRVARFTWRITGRHDLAEEITNDTLRVIWQRAAQFHGASKVSTWIFGIAYRLSMNGLRSMGRRWPKAVSMRDGIEEMHHPGDDAEVCEWVGAALAQLPEEQRTALELVYHLGHSCKEIAERVNCPVGTVKTRLFHGRRKLRQLLPKLGGLGND
jgi:RNA polymerase sigma-70 factor (ECF subfamily)